MNSNNTVSNNKTQNEEHKGTFYINKGPTLHINEEIPKDLMIPMRGYEGPDARYCDRHPNTALADCLGQGSGYFCPECEKKWE